MKRFIRGMFPKEMYYAWMLYKQRQNKKMSYKEIEKKINSQYYKIHGKNINWDAPTSYNEKLNVSKLYNKTEIKRKLSDKLEVRNWVTEIIGDKYLVPLLGVYDAFDEIDFEKLPSKFVIKCNHDSGSATVCEDKNELNLKKLRKEYAYYMKRNMAYLNFEMQYENIQPKILIEKNMGGNINDYKFICFDGKPYYCWVDVNRFKCHKRNIYDINWNLQNFNINYESSDICIPKPKKFNEMVEIVKKLSKGFDHVRVDLYEVDEDIYFGEMTFTTANGFAIISPEEYNNKLGNLWTSFKSNKN